MERVGLEVIYIYIINYIYINKKYLHLFCSSQAGGGFSYCNRHRHQKSGQEFLQMKNLQECGGWSGEWGVSAFFVCLSLRSLNVVSDST